MVAELGLNPGLSGPRCWVSVIFLWGRKGLGSRLPSHLAGVTRGLLRCTVPSEPKALVGGKILKSFLQDCRPLALVSPALT